MAFLEEYRKHVDERKTNGLPPLPLTKEWTGEVIELIKAENKDTPFLLDILRDRVNPGVDDAANVKAGFLNEILQGKVEVKAVTKSQAVKMLGMMLGGYNVQPLISALKIEEIAQEAANCLKNTVLVHDAFDEISDLSKVNSYAKEVIESWANAEWFFNKPELPEKLTVSVFKIPGEITTEDLSPGYKAFNRSDIPFHALSIFPETPEALDTIKRLKKNGYPVVLAGDVVGTGSSRKSAVNSVNWHFGQDTPGIPNKRTGVVVLGGNIAPIFFATCQDSGSLPIKDVDITKMDTGDVIDILFNDRKILKNGNVISDVEITPNTLKDEFRAGGRLILIIGRNLTRKAREALNMEPENVFIRPEQPEQSDKGYTQAQKIIGKACGTEGVRPGMYVEPETSTVGTQDGTGGMTMDEIKELAALGFSSEFVLQTLCHTAAYPKPAELELQRTLPPFINSRHGVSLKVGDGIIHSWINRLVLPDTLGTGGDSHTRFPMGISFPAGSGLIAFAAVTGHMPLVVPESVLVKFKGKIQPGIKIRDLVNAIPYYAIKQGLLTLQKKNKKNVFNGKILEIEGLPDIKLEQAFEFTDAGAERSAAACTIKLNKEPVAEYIKSNITLIEAMTEAGYEDAQTLRKRADKMKIWLENPVLIEKDTDAEYAAIIEIDMNEIKEPIVACPNDPDDVATLTEVLSDDKRPQKIEEVFVGSCMTNIGYYRALAEILQGEGHVPTRLWIAPPTKMDERELREDGYYSIFCAAGARTEVPGCSLCMGNQARVRDGAVVFSTSTRNYNRRMGDDAQVYLGSAEVAAVCAKLGRIPSFEEYMGIVSKKLEGKNEDVYRYLNFNEIENYKLKNR